MFARRGIRISQFNSNQALWCWNWVILITLSARGLIVVLNSTFEFTGWHSSELSVYVYLRHHDEWLDRTNWCLCRRQILDFMDHFMQTRFGEESSSFTAELAEGRTHLGDRHRVQSSLLVSFLSSVGDSVTDVSQNKEVAVRIVGI